MDILKEIKQTVVRLAPEAEVYLFGSRARGDNSIDSDWDILILLPGKVDLLIKEIIWNSLFEIQMKYDLVLSIAVREKKLWYENKIYHETEFYKNLSREMYQI